jgi:predicted metalloprotease with PDZ domain
MLNAFFYKRYDADPGVGTLSLTQGSEKHDHWGLIYSGGLFVGISQDLIIRKATGNKHSLDDLMQLLFNDLGGTDSAYTLEDLQSSLTRLSGQEQGEFFKRYVLGSERIPIDSYLKMSGLDAEIQNDQLKVLRRADESDQETQMIRGVLGED